VKRTIERPWSVYKEESHEFWFLAETEKCRG
jgi:hypothetical protein